MIWDTFLFHNELDLLEIRLETLYDTVDRFVILESPVTHKGGSKPLHFAAHQARFVRWMDKIVYLRFDDLPTKKSADKEGDPQDGAWLRVYAQREAIIRGIPNLQDSDTVVLSDLDEIARPEVLREFNPLLTDVAGLWLPDYIYYLNVRGQGMNHCDANIMSGAYAKRADRFGLRGNNGRQPRPIIPNAGWHFSYMGGKDVAREKTSTSAHWNSPDVKNMVAAFEDSVEAQMNRHGGLAGPHLKKVPVDASFPLCIRENVEKLVGKGLLHTPLL